MGLSVVLHCAMAASQAQQKPMTAAAVRKSMIDESYETSQEAQSLAQETR
jgi:hypothetical protein